MAVANLVIKVSGQMTELENDLKKTSDLLGDFGKSFDTTSQKAQRAQDVINKSFSGERIISQAAQIVTAVEKIGGSSKLTSDEMSRVNSVVSEALSKYQALGQAAPPAMLALAQATEKVGGESSTLAAELAQVAAKANEFSGGKIIQEATQIARAIEQIGGADKLTSTEQAKVNAVLNEAIEKYRALGQAAPQALNSLASATQKVGGPMSSLDDHLKQIEAHVQVFSGDKIIQQATQMARAVEQVGGADKLTAAEQAQVNQVVTEAIEKYRALGQTAPASLQELANATKQVEAPTSRLGSFLSDLGTQITATAAGFITAQAVIGGVERAYDALTDFVEDSVKAFANAEAAQRKMTTALQAQGNATPQVIRQFNDLAAQFQSTTAYSDDAINSIEALLVQVGDVAPRDMRKALTAATDLASGLGIDLETAATLVAKAFAGNTDTLKRYGIVLDESKLKAQGVTAVLDGINAKFGGQAQAELDTYAGRIKALANEWDNLKEAVGGAIAGDQILKLGLGQLTDFVRSASGAAADGTPSFLELAVAFVTHDKASTAAAGALERWAGSANKAKEGAEKLAGAVKLINDLTREQHEAFANPPQPPDLSALLKEALDLKGSFESLSPAQARVAIAFADVGKSAEDIAGKLKVSKQAVEETLEAHKKAVDAAKQHSDAIQKLADTYDHTDLAQKGRDLAAALSVLDQRARSGQISADQYADALQSIAKDAADIIVKGGRVPDLIQDLAVGFGALDVKTVDLDFKSLGRTLRNEVSPAFSDIERQIIEVNPEFQKVAERLNEIFNPNRTGIGDIFKNIGQQTKNFGQDAKEGLDAAAHAQELWNRDINDTIGAIRDLAQFSDGAFGQILGEISNIAGAWKSAQKAGDDYAKAVANDDTLGKLAALAEAAGAIAQATSKGSTTTRTVGGALAGAEAGYRIGAETGVPVAGAVVGAGVGALVGLIRGKLSTAGRDAVQDFANSMGGFEALHKQLDGLGAYGETLWKNLTQGVGRNNPQQAAEAIQVVQQQLAQLTADTEKYGLTWKDLPIAQQIDHISQQGGVLEGTYTRLINAGYDNSKVIKGMSSDLNDWLSNALDAGVKIPPGMEPIIKKLIEMGQLTDDNAKKLLGLSTVQLNGGSFDDIMAAAQRYGITLDSLGPKVNQINIDQVSAQLSSDFKLLTSDGEDVNAVLEGMKGKAQDVVDQALKFGDTIPDSMKPLLQALADAGKLTDLNGNKLKDLSSIHFEKPLTTAIDELVTKLDQLIDKIGNGLGGAIDRLPKRVDVDFHGDQSGYWPGETNDAQPGPGGKIPGFATGTNGYRYFGGGTLAILHGWEKVVPLGRDDFVPTISPSAGVTSTAGEMYITIQAWDGADVQRTVESKAFADALLRAKTRNTHGLGGLS